MTESEIYAASMENDALFIECVAHLFLAVANLQRVIEGQLNWTPENSEFQKLKVAQGFFQRAADQISKALKNSDDLLRSLPDGRKEKFQAQLSQFKKAVGPLPELLNEATKRLAENELPRAQDIHQMISLAIAGTGFGIEVSSSKLP